MVPTGGTGFADGSHSYSLLAATAPSELRANAQTGWQFTGGSLSVSRQSGTISIAGQANLSLTRSEGWANFVMGWSHSAPASASYFYAPATSTTANMTVTRTDGTVNLCTAGCAGSVSTGFYSGTAGSTSPEYAGSTYQFNTGSYYVNGALIFRK